MSDGFNNPVVSGDGSLVRNQIKSPDYVPNTTGWQLSKDGSADLNNATLRGELDIFGNDGSYIKLQNQTVAPGIVSPVMKMQPGAYSDGFTPLPTNADIFAQAVTVPFNHSGALGIYSPGYLYQAKITMQSSSQESATDNSFMDLAAHDMNIGNDPSGSISIFGTVLITGKLDVPYFVGTLTNASIPNNAASPAALSIASAQVNNKSQWSGGTDVVINVAGTYLAGINLDFTANATGIRQARISVNGVAVKAWNEPALSGFETTVGGMIPLPNLAVNDVVTFRAYQNSGGALSLTGFNECWLKYDLQ